MLELVLGICDCSISSDKARVIAKEVIVVNRALAVSSS